jgi:phosphate transport system protein
MPDQTRRLFHHELDVLRADIIHLAALMTEALPRSTSALLKGDLRLAQEVIEEDDRLDVLALDIEDRCYHVLALQQPMAGDLRAIVTALRLTSELERNGDLAVNICKGARRIYGSEIPPTLQGFIQRMSDEALRLTKLALDAYVEGDESLASALDDIDDQLDELHSDYIEAIFQAHHEGKVDLRAAVQLALIGRYYERIGDHAVNIGERVLYMVTGWLPEHTGAARVRMRDEQRENGDDVGDDVGEGLIE